MRPGTYLRLAQAGYVLAREGAFSLAEGQPISPAAKIAVKVARLIEKRVVRRTGRVERLANGLARLGPTYVKFGQLLATRADIVGLGVASDLSKLQDAMPPFDPALVPGLLREALGDKVDQLTEISPPIAAASIAQVHKGKLVDADGREKPVAIKLLRPGIERRFMRDLEGLYALARLAERFVPNANRFNGKKVVDALARSAQLEMDLRMEAAAISELADNCAGHDGFAVPEVHWSHSTRTVLTTSWIDAIPIREIDRLDKAGLNRPRLATLLIQSFLRQAIEDGYFHADMHPGNLFADPATGGIVAVDMGIMGRIGKVERRFLAEILYGFIARDYTRIAQLHFDIGYVPPDQSVEDFAQALRAIGEPLVGRGADEISMAKVLGQLLETTEVFNMRARPELVLLQKNMVLVEGTARMLDPKFNMWDSAEPIVGSWIRRQVGPLGRIEMLRDGLDTALSLARRLPTIAARAETVLGQIEAEHHRAHKRNAAMRTAFKWAGLAAIVLGVGVVMVLGLGGAR